MIGPLIDVKRSMSPHRVGLGEEATISIELENRGSRKAVLTLAERVPPAAELISGDLDESFMLSPGEKATRMIRLRVLDRVGISIPASTVRYRDVRGNEYATSTSPLRITVPEEKSTSESDNASNMSSISARSEKTDMMEDGTDGVQTADDVRAEGVFGLEQNFSILFILIILLLSAALARYS